MMQASPQSRARKAGPLPQKKMVGCCLPGATAPSMGGGGHIRNMFLTIRILYFVSA